MSWPLCFCCASGPDGAEQPCPDGSSGKPAAFRALEGRGGSLRFFTQPRSHGRRWLNAAWFDFFFSFFLCWWFFSISISQQSEVSISE